MVTYAGNPSAWETAAGQKVGDPRSAELCNFASKIKPNQTNPKHKIIKTNELMGREKGRGTDSKHGEIEHSWQLIHSHYKFSELHVKKFS